MHCDYDIAIVGAGLIGSALSLYLAAESDLRIALIERGSQQKNNSSPNQRVVALGKTATQVLTKVDVFSQLGPQACHPYTGMRIWDENSPGELDFDAGDTGHDVLGHMIDSHQCTLLLQQRAAASDIIDCFFDCAPHTLDCLDNRAVLNNHGQDPSEISAALVVAADGAGSWVRQQVKIFSNRREYGQRGIVARIKTQESHQDCAWQRFLSTGPIAILPLAGEQSSIVWSADEPLAEHLMTLKDSEFSAALESALENRLGKIELLSKRQSFELASQRAERYYTRNVALIGDAAHAIHPLAGQGANLGFKDIVCVSELLRKVDRDALGQPSLLARYQRQRQGDNEQTDAMMSALYYAYQNNSAAWSMVRGLGMNWLNNTNSVRRLLAEQAIGF